MKKIIFYTAALISLTMLASCQKTQINEPSMTGVTQFTATIQQTKTAIASDGKVTWVAGDEITVTDAAEPANTAIYVAQASGASTTFSLKSGETAVTTAPYTATYGDYQNQVYSSTGANCPLGANSETTNFTFSSPWAVLKITATSEVEKTISRVIVKNDNTKLSCLTCGDDGVLLSSTGKVFYITIATGTFSNLNITFETVGSKMATRTRSGELTLNAGDLLPLTLNFTSSVWENITIADILPNGFPKADSESTEPTSSAWKYSSDLFCYLSSNGAHLVFFNESKTESQKKNIAINAVVAVDTYGNYVYKEGAVTVTFFMSKGEVTSITFAGNETWNGTYQQSACIAAGTKITMRDGSQKVVEELEMGDVIRTVDHKTGEVSSAPVCFIWKTENASNAFTLTFEDEVEVTVIEEHGFYDKDERKYAFINARNAKDYIGHHFYDADNGRWLELKSCKLSNESVDAYAIVTSGHLNHLSNGMLSMCDGSIKVLANLFEFDSQLMFDADKKAADIEKYGLTPLEKVLEYKGFLEADYYDYNLMYLNVAIGKGLTTWDRVKAYSDYCVANQIF